VGEGRGNNRDLVKGRHLGLIIERSHMNGLQGGCDWLESLFVWKHRQDFPKEEGALSSFIPQTSLRCF